MDNPSVLLDLAFARNSHGYSGIPQDNRFLFDGLSASQKVNLSGMIWQFGKNWLGGDLNKLENQAVFLGCFLNDGENNLTEFQRVLRKLHPKILNSYQRFFLSREKKYKLNKMNDEFFDIIWRELFFSSLHSDSINRLRLIKYYLLNLGFLRVIDGQNGRLSKTKLDTREFDFVIFQDSRSIEVE
ncbi:hypothetical protein [Endozoicomonas atrinae]|uniref:hypothetical protein n=1 Tax=Endozoicomonas atrinae TaxID=1333660 RepID=UPI003B00FAA2